MSSYGLVELKPLMGQSGGTPYNIGSSPPPTPPVSGYSAWYDASQISGLSDGDPVATWDDLSGNGYDLTQATSASQPTYETDQINGLPAVIFNGTSDYLQQSELDVAQPDTIFIVAQLSTLDNLYPALFDNVGGESPRQFFHQNDALWVVGSPDAVTGGSPSTDTFVLTVQFNNSSSFARLNGASIITGTTGADNLENLAIGWDGGSGSTNYWNGPVAELIIYPSELSLDDIESVENYLTTKWGISA